MEKQTKKTNIWLFFLIFVSVFLITLMIQPSININNNNLENAISVSGQAEIEVDPDEAYVYMNIFTQGLDAEIVQQVNSQKSNDVIYALIEFGIKEEDIETTSYYLYPVNEWNYITQKYEENGYQLTHTLKVTTKQIDSVGALINKAVSNGANGINNVQFTLSKDLEKEVRAEALSLAGNEAQAKAENIAQSLNLKLGKIKSVSENNYYYTPYTYYPERAMASGKDYVEEDVMISPGKVTINSNLAVIYNIK